jgi:hypothetical protein
MRFLVAFLGVALSASVFAAPTDTPHRKPGLWELRMHSPDMPQPMVMQQCIDEKTDDLVQSRAKAMAEQKCSKQTVRREGDKVIGESVCSVDGSTITTTAVLTGDLAKSYRSEITMTFSPPLRGMKSSRQTVEGRWLGPCQPGQRPGDVIMPGMGSMNIPEVMKHLPQGAPRPPR